MSRHSLPGCCRALARDAARVPARPLRPQGPAAAARPNAAALDPGDLWRTGPGSRTGSPGGLPGNAAATLPGVEGGNPLAGQAGRRQTKRYWTTGRRGQSGDTCSTTSTSEKLQDHLLASHRMKPQPKPGWSTGYLTRTRYHQPTSNSTQPIQQAITQRDPSASRHPGQIPA